MISRLLGENLRKRYFISSNYLPLCGNVRYNTQLYCLAVQAGFYSDAVKCLTATQEILVRSSAGTKGD